MIQAGRATGSDGTSSATASAGGLEHVRFAAGPFRLVESVYPPGLQLAPHAHDISNISLVLSGSISEESESGVVTAGAGCAVFKPAGMVHQNRVGPLGVRIFALRLDPGWTSASRRLDAYQWCAQGEIVRAMLLLYAIAHTAPALPKRVLEERVRGWWQAEWGLGDHSSFGRSPPWLMRVQERIHSGGGNTGGVRELSNEAGNHPVYLARAFRRHLGAAPTEYVRRSRVTEAAYRLAATSDPLSRIALDHGFADQPHFCRSFKAELGLSPGRYRRLARPT